MNALIAVLTALVASTYGHKGAKVSAMLAATREAGVYKGVTTTDKTGYVVIDGKLIEVFVDITKGCFVSEIYASPETKSGLKFGDKQLFANRKEALQSLGL